MDVSFPENLELMGTDQQAKFLISLLMTFIYGVFLLWYFDSWIQLIIYMQQICTLLRNLLQKRSYQQKSNPGLNHHLSRFSHDIRVTKPLKINLDTVELIDKEETKISSQGPTRRFGTLSSIRPSPSPGENEVGHMIDDDKVQVETKFLKSRRPSDLAYLTNLIYECEVDPYLKSD